MRRLARAALPCLAAFVASSTVSAKAERPHQIYALIVALNTSVDPAVDPLRYADDDGARYYEIFAPEATSIGLLTELDRETRTLHPHIPIHPPTRAELSRQLASVNAQMAEAKHAGVETDFYFIYTGHGATEHGEGYVNLADGRLSRIDLFDLVVRPSQASFNHILVDACQSYYMVYERGASEWEDDRLPRSYDRAIEAFEAAHELEQFPNTGVILSTSSDRQSHEWSAYGSGVFSHQLRSALVGTADVDQSGSVDYLEVEAYLAAANAAVVDEKARVAFHVRPPRADTQRPLMTWRSGPPRQVLLGAGLEGRMYLRDERGVRYADFHKAADGPLVIRLLPDRRYVLSSPEGEVALDPARRAVELTALEWRAPALAQRNAISEAFRTQLYAVAYSREFFLGYTARARTAR